MDPTPKQMLIKGCSNGAGNLDEELVTSCRQFFEQKIVFKPAARQDFYLAHLKSRFPPLNPTMPERNSSPVVTENTVDPKNTDERSTDGIPHPKRILFAPAQLSLKWNSSHRIGSGLTNMGNTCFLNSVLQCLTYTAPLHNYLVSGQHKANCHIHGFCAMCELHCHIQQVTSHSGEVVRPALIVQNLRVIGKHFRQGRQEDAHEFLRYFVDCLQKSSLHGLPGNMDPYSKATTVVHQVFGGYHCSQVKCTKCMKTSETFDPLLDVSLDIKTSSCLTHALQRFTKPDKLDGENEYACPFCKEMTPAWKRLTLHRLPNVLTIQLKRFDYNSMFGGKITKPVTYPQYVDMRPYMTNKKGPSEWYQLYAVLVHMGFSSRSGHYYCYVRNSNKVWYCLNDCQVHQVGMNQVLQQEAYLLFYVQVPEYSPPYSGPDKHKPNPIKPANPKVRQDPNFIGTLVKHSPKLDKTGTPLVRHTKPTGVVPPSPQSPAPYSHTYTKASLSPSIPLKKCTTPHQTADKEKPTAAVPHQSASAPISRPLFMPRVITAPASTRKVRPPLHKFGTPGVAKKEVEAVAEQKQSLFPPAKEEEKGQGGGGEGAAAARGGGGGGEGEGGGGGEGAVARGGGGEGAAAGGGGGGGGGGSEADGGKGVPLLSQVGRSISNTGKSGGGENSFQDGALMTAPAGEKPNRIIGPILPPHLQQLTAPSEPTTLPLVKSPKVARVKPQLKAAKPVALVHPVMLESSPTYQLEKGRDQSSSSGHKKEVEGDATPTAHTEPQGQQTSSSSHSNTVCTTEGPSEQRKVHDPSLVRVRGEEDSNSSSILSCSEPQRVKKKKKKKHKFRSISGKSEGGSKDGRKFRKKTGEREAHHMVREGSEENGEEERQCKKHKQKHKKKDGHKDRKKLHSPSEKGHHRSKHLTTLLIKRSKHVSEESPRRREHSSSSGGEDTPAHRSHYHKHTHRKKRRHTHREGEPRRYDRERHDKGSWHGPVERDGRYSGSEGKPLHRSKHQSPSPERRKRKRSHRSVSSDSDGGHSKWKVSKCDAHGAPRNHHGHDYHRHHHSGHKPNGGREEDMRTRDEFEEKHSGKHGRIGKIKHIVLAEKPKAYSSSSHDERDSESPRHQENHRHIHTHPRQMVRDSEKSVLAAAGEKTKHKGAHSTGNGDPSTTYTHEERDQHKKAHLVVKTEEREREREQERERRVGPVPEVMWDSTAKERKEAGGLVGTIWDGAPSSCVVEVLTNHAHNQLGSKVKTWDGGDNVIDSTQVAGEWTRPERDPWEKELDRGRVKNVKKHKDTHFPQKNQFQDLQNKKNVKLL